jgi:dihydroneopterin aldolase
MVASASSTAEAEIAIAGGADQLDIENIAKRGEAPAPDIVQHILETIGGRRPASAATGTREQETQGIVESATALAAMGIDHVRICLASRETAPATIGALEPLAAHTALTGVLFADLMPDLSLIALMARGGFKGAMLATSAGGRLFGLMDIAALSRFTQICEDQGLISGLAGALQPPDISRLLLLQPGFLIFGAALCHGKKRQAGLDIEAVRMVRDLVPREAAFAEGSATRMTDWRQTAGRSGTGEASEKDRVFVHDFVMPVAIGAYDFERGVTQRVRFNIDVDIRRSQHAQDMRDVFSYDLIIDAIRLVLGRGHVVLVEAMAEQIAEIVLRHPRTLNARVRVEKLDIIEGAVGVEIERKRRSGTSASALPRTRRREQSKSAKLTCS